MEKGAWSNYVFGSVSCLIASILYALGMASAQTLGGFIPDNELNAFRFVPQLLVSGMIIGIHRQNPLVDRRSGGWILLMGLFGLLGNFFMYAAAPIMPVSLILGLQSAMMLLFGSIQQTISDRACKVSVLSALVLCTVGVTLITQPTFLGFAPASLATNDSVISVCYDTSHLATQPFETPPTTNDTTIGLEALWIDNLALDRELIGYIFIFLSALGFYGNYFVINKWILQVHSQIISFWGGFLNTVLSAVLMLIVERPTVPTNAACWGWLLCHGWTIGIGTALFIYSAQLIPPVAICILRTLMIACLAIFQYTFLRRYQPGHRNWEEILGICLVIVGNIIPSVMDWWAAKKTSRMEGYENMEPSEDEKGAGGTTTPITKSDDTN